MDADVANVVFGSDPNDGARRLIGRLADGRLRIVVGGKTLKEQYDALSTDARLWLFGAVRAGWTLDASDADVDALERSLELSNQCKSNDQHIIALAQVSGARLLYSNDQLLIRDFTNRELLREPQGRRFPAEASRLRQEELLNSHDLCTSHSCGR